jgi:lipopolysaccharide transport system permease protein
LLQMINELARYRDLMYMLTMRDIRIRYKQAMMGFLWAIFMPMVAVASGVLIKKAMAVVSGHHIDLRGILSISVKVLPWTFFISSIRFSVQCLVGNSDLVTKIYFPRAVLPLASVAACFFDLSLSIVVLLVLLTVVKLGLSFYLLWVPAIIFFLLLYTVGLGLLLATLNLFFRDVKYIVEVILMFGIFFTPVFYDAGGFGNWKPLLLLNPMGSILESLNQAVVMKQMPDPIWLAYAALMSIIVFYVGMVVFHAQEQSFAENI